MKRKFKYATVSEAVSALREMGFDKDFHLKGNAIVCEGEKLKPSELKIAITYRYEGETDPGDEASVYGLEARSGLKGILVTADGTYSDAASAELLKTLHAAKNKGLRK